MCKLNKHNAGRRIDPCLKPLIEFLQDSVYDTVGCCCGHEKYPITVVVKESWKGKDYFLELFTQTELPRTKRFYKKDKQGYYYIPETIK